MAVDYIIEDLMEQLVEMGGGRICISKPGPLSTSG